MSPRRKRFIQEWVRSTTRRLAAGRDMGTVAVGLDQLPHRIVVVPLVETEVLGTLSCGLRPLDHHRLECRLGQFHVVAIGAVDYQANGHTMPLGQKRSLGSALAPVSRVGAGFFPRQGGPWSSLHPSLAIPSRCRRWHRTGLVLPARACGTAQPRARPGSGHARCCLLPRSGAVPSTGTLFVARRRPHPSPVGLASRAFPPSGEAAPLAGAASPEGGKALD